ncbi:MAG: WYL domain-containing protein [Fibrobacter sp.]|nr:WYL domain-containing protein [Fibrobacter sp.]
MSTEKRGERLISLFIQLISNPQKSYTVTQLLSALNLREEDRRNVQRDMRALAEFPGKYVIVEGSGPNKKYKTGFSSMDRLSLPNLDGIMLQFVFLQRIANIYPGTAKLIDNLLDKIRRNLPASNLDKFDEARKDINSRVLFKGTPPGIDEDTDEKLKKHYTESSKTLELLREKIRNLSLFDKETQIEKVKLTFPKWASLILKEQPYHPTMKISEKKDHLVVTMKVCVNFQLRQWLLKNELNEVNILEPAYLRREMHEIAMKMARKYHSPVQK